MKKNEPMKLFGGIGLLDLANFTKHLSVMLKAGISISESLDTLLAQTKSPRLKKTIKQLMADTNNGAPLSAAMDKFPRIFDQFYISIIQIGEESGTLDGNLEYLAQKLHKDLSLRRAIKEALFYPTIVVCAALIVGLGISIFVLPKMGDLFLSFDMKLPLSTRILLGFSSFMKKYNILVPIAMVGLLFLFRVIIRTRLVRPAWSRVVLSLPFLGNFNIAIETSAFCRNLGIMLSSSLPISQALEIVENTTRNYVFQHYMSELRKAVSGGKQLAEQLTAGKFPYLPYMAARMISVGEKSGKLNDMLLYLGQYYEEETDSMAKNFSSVIEPVLLVFIGIIVAILAMAVIGPIYQLTGSIK